MSSDPDKAALFARCYPASQAFHLLILDALSRALQLRGDIAPITCANFQMLCLGSEGVGARTKKPLTYKGTRFHRIMKDFCAAAGDIEVHAFFS